MLFLLILKRSFEDSAIKLLFQPIDSSSKLILQSIGLGNISQLSIIFSGGFIFLVSTITDDSLLLYVLLSVLFFSILWLFIISGVSENLNNYIKQSLRKLSIKLPKKPDDSTIGINTYLANELSLSNEVENSFSSHKIGNFLTIQQYQQLYSDQNLDPKQFNNHYLEFSKNFEILLHQKALLLGISPHVNMSNFVLNQLNVTTSFELRLFIFKYLSRHKIELKDEHLKSISLIMNDVFDYYSCILSSILDLNYVDNHRRIVKMLEKELSVLEDIIFSYLEIMHSKNQIDLIRYSLKSGELHENILALELLESLISEEFKKVILTIFDNLSIKSKVDNISKSFDHYSLKFDERLNYILNSPAYWFNDLIRMEAIDLIPENYHINNSALLSNMYNSNKFIKNTALKKLEQIDKNNKYNKFYSNFKNSKTILEEFDLVSEKINIGNLNQNFKFQLYSQGSLVDQITDKEIEKLNDNHYILLILDGSVKLVSKKVNTGDIVYEINSIKYEKSMFSNDVVYLRISHQKLVPFIMSNPNFADKIVLNQ